MQTTTGNLLWDKLDLHPWLEEAVKSLEFKLMTPVQASTIPLLCGSKDVIVESVTGSGKTLAFVIPMLEKLSRYLYVEKDKIKKGHFFGVVISPTRELSNQINNVFLSVLKFLPPELIPIKTQLLVGGNSTIRDDLSYFANNSPQILIATPGRLLDFISSQKVKLNSIEMVILDEADKLLDISFSKDVINILHKLPKQRRTGLFSATLSAAGDNVFRTGMTNPVKITVKGSTTSNVAPKSLNLSYMLVDPKLKIMTLLKLLEKYRFKKAIVYFPTCTSIKYFYAMFKHCLEEYPCQFYSLHGKLTTNSRLKILNLFTNADSFDGKHVLMTTDVAARGIDIPDVDLVIQIDPPTDPDIFLHRCGRTGRANKVGKAITFLNGSENSHEIEYVDFMAVKHVDILPMETEDVGDIDWFYDKVQQWILKDRLLYELSVKSYVGFVKYYSKHIASSIFRLNLLDYVALGKMYGLIRLPKMPELKYVPADQFPEDGWFIEPMDMDNYAYADEAKEHKRLAELEAEKAKKIEASKRRKELEKKNESWSKKIEKKEVKTERKEKIKRKRDVIEQEIEDDSSDEEVAVDWKDLVRENKKNKSSMQGSFDDL